jgi:hypothetical protein
MAMLDPLQREDVERGYQQDAQRAILAAQLKQNTALPKKPPRKRS